MDRFLFAFNPNKAQQPTGLQGYIIDTVKHTWMQVTVFNQAGSKRRLHECKMISGTGSNEEDTQSALRGTRWYNAWLINRKIKEADIQVLLPDYDSHLITEGEPEKEEDIAPAAEKQDEVIAPEDDSEDSGAPVVSLK